MEDGRAAKRRKAGSASAVVAPLDRIFAKQRVRGDKENAGPIEMVQQESNSHPQPAKRSVEQIYQKKTQQEHILLRPDSYVGSIERQSQEHWVFDQTIGRMVKRKLDYVPALYKIFDELVVNAADNLVRSPEQDTIRVNIDVRKGTISVMNNGTGLPVQMHREHQCYIPELVFGHLLTSDNYDDNEKKVTGGRNGYGAKLTNIFSTTFIVETADSRSGKLYKQVWEKNMSKCSKPDMKPFSGDDFTCITFTPDLARFGMRTLEQDIVALMKRRAYDIAAVTQGRCKVYLNGEALPVQSFRDYVALHLPQDAWCQSQVVNDRWEVAVALTDGSGFQQVSFVNSISTSRGGTHVNYVSDQLVSSVLDSMSKQKGTSGNLHVKAAHVRGYLWVFLNCLIENPAFDSQTKETLTSKRERFGSACSLPEDFIQEVLESGIITALQEWSSALSKSELAQHLNRSDHGLQKRLFGIPKLEDANKAGTKEANNCTLILTEGDSAKALAVAGLGIVGRDNYGVFPLRGKLRNVRDLTIKQMLENKEIDQVMRIMALDASKTYVDAKGLRYGSIMIMTDQDYDGSHIKGLIINFIQHWFPSLLQVPGFLKEFVTPIVKVTKGEASHTFFTLPEYNAWKEENTDGHGWKCKYYKGLGTSTSQEAREYFADLSTHEIQFTYNDSLDEDLIDMAFNNKRADDRKEWIRDCEDGTYVDHSEPTLSYSDFVKKELVLFAKYDVERMIPSMIDGFKPGQRKVLFGCFKKKVTSDIKVAQLSGYVAEVSAYHHGESSLQGTIISLAQNFVGSNNVNLLVPSGQFGTRLQGGKDHAAARYIFTRLSRAARCIFSEEDDPVLEYLNEEGLHIEPKYYWPVIPMVLVNGADGIGVGWSTTVPNYNPRDLIANIRRALRNEPLERMLPWYKGFTGSITEIPGAGRYESSGVAARRCPTRLEITELPIRRWTQDYKEWLLEQLPQNGSEKRALVNEFREHHTENSVHFTLSMTPDKMAEAERRGLEKTFHLRSNLSTTNMMLFDAEGRIRKYENPEEILTEFVHLRLQIYEKRKAHIVAKLERELALISNKLKFVELVVNGELDVENRKSADLNSDLRRHGLQWMRDINAGSGPALSPAEESGPLGFKYLLSMKLWSLTEDRVDELRRLHSQKSTHLEKIRSTSLEEMWEADLVKLEDALDQCDREDAKEAEAAAKLVAKKSADDDSGLSNKQCVIVLSKDLKVKRVRSNMWKARRRGLGLKAAKSLFEKKATKKNLEGVEGEENEEQEEEGPEEALEGVFCCRDFDALLVFSKEGQVYKLQALDVPLSKKASAEGSPFSDLLPDIGKGRITALVTVPQGALRDQTDEFVVLVSAKGFAKKVSLDRFRVLKPGKSTCAMKLADKDEMKWALRASANSALVIASTAGLFLRFSLGEDWYPSTLKGPGRLAMKTAHGNQVASCGISQMTEEEIKVIAARVAQRAAAKNTPADGFTDTNGHAKTGEAVEEDSDKENEETQALGGGDGEGQEDDENDSEGADSDAEKQGKPPEDGVQEVSGECPQTTGNVDAEMGEAVAGCTQISGSSAATASKGPAVQDTSGQHVLMITERGLALRMPLAHRKIGLRKKGGKGIRLMKLHSNDNVVALCVLSCNDAKQPDPPASAFTLFTRAHKDDLVAESHAADTKLEAGNGFAMMHLAQERFKSLPQEEQAVYQTQAEEERNRYANKMAEYRKTSEEVLVGSSSGSVSRIVITSVPVSLRPGRGKALVKLRGDDTICVATLLSSMDEDPDEEQKPSEQNSALAAKPARANGATILRPRVHKLGSGGPIEGSSTDLPLVATPTTKKAGQCGLEKTTSVQPEEHGAGRKFGRRLRGKTRICPFFGARGRLSMLRMMRSNSSRSLRLSIVKPKLRLLTKTRKSFIMQSINVQEWARRASNPAE